jgi:hypothetical protein
MNKITYRAGLISALDKMIEANNCLFDGAVSIALSGELKDWSDTVPVGEVHTFEFDLLKNSQDSNVRMMIDMMEQIQEMYDRICNLNGIEMERGNSEE